jgi:hypothetical protein
MGPWLTFEVRVLAPFAYAFFALALGVAAGANMRQTVAAMFATGALFVALRLAVAHLRPYFLPPLSAQVTAAQVSADAASPAPSPWTALVVQKAVDPFHKSVRLLYQPSDRFLTFQGIEAAIFVALGLALLALTLWWMRHRTT